MILSNIYIEIMMQMVTFFLDETAYNNIHSSISFLEQLLSYHDYFWDSLSCLTWGLPQLSLQELTEDEANLQVPNFLLDSLR